MKICRTLKLGLAIGLLGALMAGSAWAASVSGRASTVLEWFDDAQEDTALVGYQYLQLNVKDLGAEGYHFRGYGRLADDLADEVDADSRLYYAYIEKKNLFKSLDAKFGRQFISTSAGASLMDGLHLDYHDLGPLGIKLFGGGDVSYYEGYNAKDLIAGTEVYGRFFDSLDLGVSYLQRWEDSELANELIGLDVDYTYANVISLYSETQFDYLSDSVSYFLAGARYFRNPKWSLRTEYLYSLPVFSSTSIYSVFAVDEYQEVSAELGYSLAPGLRTFALYTREIYQDFDDANVYEAGIEKIRTERFSGYLIGTLRDAGDSQDLYGFKAYASYLFCPSFQAGLGAHVDVIERRLEEQDDETTSSRLWVDATTYLSKKLNVQAKVERVESDLWDDYYRGRVRLNILF
ncbi:hypothetical protein DESUT3_38410 [Desulfuromonas versatilis]|uniref:Porin n=1 Tax=Desulfuromonas versatilis TaxID=2802975 RepID=A0ABM8HXM1_9BACT|nr:hypothetical protein [Desulfuromonas versatilis]BCR06772.1 hypothetical protein DESUT3_38410 [Desulfuromonas versatilis]